MGTWGTGSFENDAALDWLGDLQRSSGLELLEASVGIDPSDYLEVDDGVVVIAASQVIAALLGRPDTELPEPAREWVVAHSNANVTAVVPHAIAALDAVLGERSELRDLWEENDPELPLWEAAVRELRDRLIGSRST